MFSSNQIKNQLPALLPALRYGVTVHTSAKMAAVWPAMTLRAAKLGIQVRNRT